MKKRLFAMMATTLALSTMLTACSTGTESTSTPAASTPAASSSSSASSTASESTYPGNKNITLYCGYSAGGSSDTLCRLMAAKVGEILGTTCTVENVTGASGWVLWNQMLEATEPDGYSFCLVNAPNVTAGKYDLDNPMKYDHNDFELIANHVTDSSCMAIRVDDDRYSDWDSFSSYWKEQGVLITSASGLTITSDDSTTDYMMANDLGVEIDIIASGGSGDNITFLLNKTTDFVMGNVSEMVGAHKEGQFKILCVYAEERDPNLPDVPTYEELTGTPMVGCSSRGYAMLKDTPEDVKEILSAAVKEAIQDPDMVQQLLDIYTTTDFREGEAYANYLNDVTADARAAFGV